MAHSVTLTVPDDVYQSLSRRATETGLSVEVLAVEYLAREVEHAGPGSRLSKWAGAFASGVPDAGVVMTITSGRPSTMR